MIRTVQKLYFGVAGGTKRGKRLVIIRWTSLPQPPVFLPQDDTLGSQLKYLRRCLGETQTTFATFSGHPASLIAKYERNEIKKPNYQVLLDFAKALKVNPDKLLSIQCFQPIKDTLEFDKLFECLTSSPQEFGFTLRNLRLKATLGQKALAKKVGLNRESIRRYEKNITKPNKEILSRIINVLKKSYKVLQDKYYHKNSTDSRNLERRG